VPCGDISQLARALERVCLDAAERRRLGQAGRERLGRDFCWEDKLQLVRQTYARLAGAGTTL
jgi:hypothetical protein